MLYPSQVIDIQTFSGMMANQYMGNFFTEQVRSFQVLVFESEPFSASSFRHAATPTIFPTRLPSKGRSSTNTRRGGYLIRFQHKSISSTEVLCIFYIPDSSLFALFVYYGVPVGQDLIMRLPAGTGFVGGVPLS